MNRTELRQSIAAAITTTSSYQAAYDYEPLASSFDGATPILLVVGVSSERDSDQSTIRATVLRHTVTATIFVAFDPGLPFSVADAEIVLDDRVRAALAALASRADIILSASERLSVTDVAYRAERITLYHEETL